MVTLLITSFLLIAGITYAVYLWQRPSSKEEAQLTLSPPPMRPITGLFDEALPNDTRSATRALSGAVAEERREDLLKRAVAGDKGALDDALSAGDDRLYDEVLDELTGRSADDKALLALASYIARSDGGLRVNSRLAAKFIETWKRSPDRNSTAKMLHMAALANDADTYRMAIEAGYQFWRERRLTGISADELRQLIEGEFWLIAPGVRNSGAGFVLKRKLAQIRRQLVLGGQKSVTGEKRSDG